ncbi:flagellar hook-length control protein FliK [Clostridium botulinum]|uniref:Flagellar hook-length control protein n=1 Tax=Clostridium botulinum B str. Osaka05 TaxID=1407017 RepID=A0A0S6U833_CLOBO|nr:flagellar hook-length control protein FliK [Clostridium botulinum]MBO0523323.1 flagellar hook-length control protein FliK [Clostridium botulinum]MBO0533169.1 flagellar hook-length control protein FliK [Clostridium botulinum]MBO0536954.1 flagellar hook-length control protein FliK [Clostridium botulinum]MBO0538628.1 flagellar hook-length control protein FliK [Clostridium botulinum]MBO0542312.1 flagellar hook-length control protein FliK [Clostridium botulinum]
MELKISGFNKTENNLVTKNATNQSEKSYSFNEVLNSISSNKNKNISTKQDVQQDNKNYLIKNENINNKDNSMMSKLNKEDIQKIKDKLAEQGFSKEELDSIKSLDDLKNLVEKIKDAGDLDNFVALVNSILQCLYSGQNVKLGKELEQNLDKLKVLLNNLSEGNGNKEQLLIEIKNILGEEFNKLNLTDKNSLDKDLLETFSNKLQTQIEKEPNAEKVSLLKNIKSEMENILKEESNNNNKLSVEPKINVDEPLIVEEETDSSNLKENTSKEDKLLKGLLEDKQQSAGEKINKAVNFMSHLKNSTDINELSSKEALGNLVINKNTMNADIIKSIKYMELNNVKDLTVKIMPKELGEVFIKLTMEGGIMKANIGATTKEAYNLLNSNMQLIEDKLQNSGIKVQELSLNIYNEDTTFFKQGNEKGKNSNPSKSGNKENLSSMDEIPEEENISTIDGNVNILA